MSEDGWMPLGQYMRELEADPVYLGFMGVITTHRSRRSRRIVQVVRRKYLARRGRR